MIDEQDAHTERPNLDGRKAIVTGGTTGIGRAIAVLLASYGVRVFVCGRTPEHLDDALKRIDEVGEGDGINVDLSLAEDVDRFFEAARAYLGEIDIAIINAAIPASALADSGESEARYQLDTDLTAYLICAQEAARCILGAEPRLDGVPRAGNLFLLERQPLPRCDPELPFHEIEPRDRLSDWMLHLQPGVHLDEVPRRICTQAAALHQKLHGAGALIANGLGELHGGRSHLLPKLR